MDGEEGQEGGSSAARGEGSGRGAAARLQLQHEAESWRLVSCLFGHIKGEVTQDPNPPLVGGRTVGVMKTWTRVDLDPLQLSSDLDPGGGSDLIWRVTSRWMVEMREQHTLG